MKFTDLLPYIFSAISALVAGLWSYFGARKQAKDEIDRLVKQHELDIEKERERFKMEKEKMEIEHHHQIELLQKEAENNTNSEILKAFMSEVARNPEIQRQISQGARNGNNRNHQNRR